MAAPERFWFSLVISLLLLFGCISAKKLRSPAGPEPTRSPAEKVELCKNFSVGSPLIQELFSPNYPGLYPNNLNCSRVIEAGVGQAIKLTFLDQFEVEPSPSCEHDYLEIRDGAHGYSEVLGRFCGNSFPSFITSSDRYMWLYFESDGSIEYTGFRVLYEFFENRALGRPELHACGRNVSGEIAGYIDYAEVTEQQKNFSEKYDVPLDCTWNITTMDTWKLRLKFLDFELSKPNDCETNFIDVFGDKTDLANRLMNFCSTIAESVSSKSKTVHVRFYATGAGIKSNFKILYIPFRDKGPEDCPADEFDCDDATCIKDSLRCDFEKHCFQGLDEEDCPHNRVPAFDFQSGGIMSVLVIGFVMLLGMFFALFFDCARKLRKDRREYIAKSRDTLDTSRKQSKHSTVPSASIELGVTSAPMTTSSPEREVLIGDDPIVPKKKNGNAMLPNHNPNFPRPSVTTVEPEDDTLYDVEEVEMRDNECQTRDSLLLQNADTCVTHNENNKNSESALTTPPAALVEPSAPRKPPIPAKPLYIPPRNARTFQMQDPTRRTSADYSMRRPSEESSRRPSVESSSRRTSVTSGDSTNQRLTTGDSGKSASDVIVKH